MTNKEKIVTFSCSKSVHIYGPKSGLLPMFPYRDHPTIDEAKKFLTEREGDYEIKLVYL